MPIKPPRLDDRSYDDLIAETKKLIPQYCPEWTNFSNADPGMTVVQLFSWMTELIMYRLNRVPDKTYIHFLNFIGEERKSAQPSIAPLTFSARLDRPIEVASFSVCSTKQSEKTPALNFTTTNMLTIHGSTIEQMMVVKGGEEPLVRELPFSLLDNNPSVITFDQARGVAIFDIDPVDYGPDSYTSEQYLYVGHEDFRKMDIELDIENPSGFIRMLGGKDDKRSIIELFDWEYPTASSWLPCEIDRYDDERGNVEKIISANFPNINGKPIQLGNIDSQLPEEIQEERWWIRGRLNYERWLVEQMPEDLQIFWRDDRGKEEREIFLMQNNLRANGRVIEFGLQDLPPIRAGWMIRFSLVDRGFPAGKNSYLPKYRWSYRRGEVWEEIPEEQIRIERTEIELLGPLPNMATDGINIRAERIETVNIKGLCYKFNLDMTWTRPVEIDLLQGDDVRRLEETSLADAPLDPFQITANFPPTIGRKLYIGSDVLSNKRQEKVAIELEFAFEMNGDFVPEPTENYALQLCYRANDSWRVVWDADEVYNKFVFNDIIKAEEPGKGKQKVSFLLDPKENLEGIAPLTIHDIDSSWLRLELVKSNLTALDENKEQHPVRLRIFNIRVGFQDIETQSYSEPLLSPKTTQIDFREKNRRLTKVHTRVGNKNKEFYPYYRFIDIESKNQSFYMKFDKPLPVGSRHALHFRCRGETYLNQDLSMEWEILEIRRKNYSWRRLSTDESKSEGLNDRKSYAMNRTGVLEFPLPDIPQDLSEGFWLRGRFASTKDEIHVPSLPPITHIMLNTVNAVNLHTARTERFSGQGIPHQEIKLLKSSIFLHEKDDGRNLFPRRDLFTDIRVQVDSEIGRVEWKAITDSDMLVATKDDKVFTVDPVEGILRFGNGIRGSMLPVGSNNILVDIYRTIPGAKGNVAPGAISVCDFNGILDVVNLLPATGGRDAETVDEIVRRAPSLLTTRDRAVTKNDFEVIAKESSSEIARAACMGLMDTDGDVEVVILPNRREDEVIPNNFLSGGLRDHVSAYLKRRCLINVNPIVRLAEFMPIDISITLRLRPNSDIIAIREQAQKWVQNFLDPYTGGLDGDGWPFGGTLYGQDLARMVVDIPDVRHVTQVSLFNMSSEEKKSSPGWESQLGDVELSLSKHDLYVVRRMRVLIEENR